MSGLKNPAKARQSKRHAPAYLAYRNSARREHNKIVRIKRHLGRYGEGDKVALAAIENARKVIRGY